MRPKPYGKNTIPVIISGVDKKFKSWRKLSGELRQYHPSLKISRIKELPKGDFALIGDTLQDVIILQNEDKMKAVLATNVKVGLPQAFQANKEKPKSLEVKGVPADITDDEFTEFLNLNQISYAKAERFKSNKDGRILQMINHSTEAEALISQSLVCQVTGIVYEVEEFRSPVSIKQCYNYRNFGYSAKTKMSHLLREPFP